MNETLVYSWYEQYRTGIFRFALSILRDSQAAEDVLQETFVRLLSSKNLPAGCAAGFIIFRTATTIKHRSML